MPRSQLPRHFARPARQRHESRREGVEYRYGVVLSEAAGDSSPAGVGLTGSGVRRGRSVGAGVGVGASVGAGVAVGVGVAGAGVGVGFGVAGAGVAGCAVGAAVGASATGLTRETIAALTTKAPPAAAMVTRTMVKAVVAAATGRMTRAKSDGRTAR
jgi:hypothetical protein